MEVNLAAPPFPPLPVITVALDVSGFFFCNKNGKGNRLNEKCKQTAEKYAVLPKYGNLDIILSLDFYVKQ